RGFSLLRVRRFETRGVSTMLTRSPQLNASAFAVRVHEAAYKIAARKFGIRLRKTRTDLGLRRNANDVFDLYAALDKPGGAAAAASIMLIGRAAVGALAPAHQGSCYDQIEAGNALYLDLFWRGGTLHNPNLYRELHLTLARLQTEAENFVRDNREEIVRIADQLDTTTDDLAATS